MTWAREGEREGAFHRTIAAGNGRPSALRPHLGHLTWQGPGLPDPAASTELWWFHDRLQNGASSLRTLVMSSLLSRSVGTCRAGPC